MKISLIAAMDENKIIGAQNQLPWHLPADLKHFKALTLHKPVIMGRKTYESIGKPLPERTNIILTHASKNLFSPEQPLIAHSIEEAIALCGKNCAEIMVIGGAAIFKQFMPRADFLYLTIIHHKFSGDCHFPNWNEKEWREIFAETHETDEKNSYRYTFMTLERI